MQNFSHSAWLYYAYLFQHAELKKDLRRRTSAHMLSMALGLTATFLMLLLHFSRAVLRNCMKENSFTLNKSNTTPKLYQNCLLVALLVHPPASYIDSYDKLATALESGAYKLAIPNSGFLYELFTHGYSLSAARLFCFFYLIKSKPIGQVATTDDYHEEATQRIGEAIKHFGTEVPYIFDPKRVDVFVQVKP